MPVIVQRSGIKKVVIERDDVSSTITKDTRTLNVASTGLRGPSGPRGYDGASGTVEVAASRENGSPYTLLVGQVVAVNANKWYVASAAPGPWAEAVGFVYEQAGIVAGGTGRAQVGGVFSLLAPQWDLVQDYVGGLVPETPYYLSTTGKISPVPPALDSGMMLARVGYALNSTDMIIEIEPTIQL